MRKPVTWDRLLWTMGYIVLILGIIPFSRCSTMNLETVPIQSLSITDFETTITFFENPTQIMEQRSTPFYVLALFAGESANKGIMVFKMGGNESMVAYSIGDPLSEVLSWWMGAPVTHFQWLGPRSLKLIFLEISPYLQQDTIIHALAFTVNNSLGEVEESCSSIIQFYGDEFIDSSTSSTTFSTTSSTTSTESNTSVSPFAIPGFAFEILILVLFVGVSALIIHQRRKK